MFAKQVNPGRCVLLLALLLPQVAWGNGAPMYVPPQTAARVQSPVVVSRKALEMEKDGVVAKIVIPLELIQKELKRIEAEENGEVPDPFAPTKAPAESPNQKPAPKQQSYSSPGRTMIAGIAMSLAAVSLVFVVRRKSSVSRTGLMLVAGLIVATASAVALADIAVPGQVRRLRPMPPAAEPEAKEGESTVILEFTSGGFPRNKSVRVLLRD